MCKYVRNARETKINFKDAQQTTWSLHSYAKTKKRPANHPAISPIQKKLFKRQATTWVLCSYDKNNVLVMFQLSVGSMLVNVYMCAGDVLRMF